VAITAPQFPILSPIGSPFLPVQPSSQSGRLIPGGFVYSSQGNRQNGSWPMLMNPMPYYPIDPRGIEESDLVKAGIQPNGSKKDFIIQILHDTGAQIDAIPANIYHDEIRDTNLLPRGTPPPPTKDKHVPSRCFCRCPKNVAAGAALSITAQSAQLLTKKFSLSLRRSFFPLSHTTQQQNDLSLAHFCHCL
jgi:hypothetical protein